jgi:hypothetical protein
MKAAIEAMTKEEMGSYKATSVFNLPQTTLQRYVSDRHKRSSEAIKTKLGTKHVLPREAENDLAEYCLMMKRKFFGLTVADVKCLAYQLAVRNGITNQFCKRNEKTGRNWLKNFYVVIKIFQLQPLKFFTLKSGGFTPELIAVFLNLRIGYAHCCMVIPACIVLLFYCNHLIDLYRHMVISYMCNFRV